MRLIAIMLIALSLLVGCGEQEKAKPEDAAVAFFNALYNEKDLALVKQYASQKLQKELARYKSTSHLSRQFMYLSFDKVKIDAALGDKALRSKFYKSGKLTVLFDGTYNSKRIKELREVQLVQVGEKWLVDEISDKKPY